MVQQMKRKERDDFNSFFELRYKNGVRTEKASLDEITADNNSGAWKIQELKMALLSRNRLKETKLEIEFRVPPTPPSKDATEQPHSIQYYVVGDERDWVYLTSSQLDDRIANIKQLPIFYYGVAAIAIGLSMLIVFLAMLSSTASSKLPLGYEIVAILASGLIISGGIACIYGFPLYNFIWGDYIKTFTYRRTVGKYVINGVIISLVLSVIGSIIGTLFFLK